jgi:protein SCO1/2
MNKLHQSLFVVSVLCATLFAHGGHSHGAGTPGDSLKKDADTTASAPIGVDEKLGSIVPLSALFVTEKGDTVPLKSLIQGPTIISLLYYKCPNACSLLLMSIANVLRSFADNPEKSPHVLCMSIDENETIADARKAKAIAFQAIQKPYPQDHWHFLTGSDESIDAVADAVGFHFAKKGDDFDHPMCLIVLSPQGKVVRYIMGTDYLPADVSMSLMEASTGTIQPTIARVLRVCFSYDPKSHRLVFNLLQVSATVIITLLAIFITYLVISGKNRNAKGKPQ